MALFKALLVISSSGLLVTGDHAGHGRHNHNRGGRAGFARRGRQESEPITGGIDFTGCQTDPETSFCCIEKDEEITSLQKDPILECTHKNVEKCHYTYVTQFTAAQEEVCEENFEKICQLTFKQQAFNETVKKCYRPLEKVCNGQGPEECKTVYESSCTTKYVEKSPGKFVGDTACEKLPIEICGAGCITEEGAEECHDKTITSLVDVPEEVCDLNPQKTCRFQTKLVPKLSPKHECTIFPQETCNLKFSAPKQVTKILKTKWCQDPTPAVPGESYEESKNEVIRTPQEQPIVADPEPVTETDIEPDSDLPTYQTQSPSTLYDAPISGIDQRGGRDSFQGALPEASSFNNFQVQRRRNNNNNGRRNNGRRGGRFGNRNYY